MTWSSVAEKVSNTKAAVVGGGYEENTLPPGDYTGEIVRCHPGEAKESGKNYFVITIDPDGFPFDIKIFFFENENSIKFLKSSIKIIIGEDLDTPEKVALLDDAEWRETLIGKRVKFNAKFNNDKTKNYFLILDLDGPVEATVDAPVVAVAATADEDIPF